MAWWRRRGRPTAWAPMARVAIGGAAAATTMEAETTASTTAMTSAGDEREDEETVFKCKKLKVCGVQSRKREAFLLLRSRQVAPWSRCRLLAGTPARNAGEDSHAVVSFPREPPSSVLVVFLCAESASCLCPRA